MQLLGGGAAGIGALLMLIGVIWLVVTAIQTGQNTGEKVLWALVNLFCQPLGGIIFFIVKKRGLIPLLLVIVGLLLYTGGVFMMIDIRDLMKMMK